MKSLKPGVETDDSEVTESALVARL